MKHCYNLIFTTLIVLGVQAYETPLALVKSVENIKIGVNGISTNGGVEYVKGDVNLTPVLDAIALKGGIYSYDLIAQSNANILSQGAVTNSIAYIVTHLDGQGGVIIESDPSITFNGKTITIKGQSITPITEHQNLSFSNDYLRVGSYIDWGEITNTPNFLTESSINSRIIILQNWTTNRLMTITTNLESKINSATPGNYLEVSNKAMSAIQNLSGYATTNWVKSQDYLNVGFTNVISTDYLRRDRNELVKGKYRFENDAWTTADSALTISRLGFNRQGIIIGGGQVVDNPYNTAYHSIIIGYGSNTVISGSSANSIAIGAAAKVLSARGIALGGRVDVLNPSVVLSEDSVQIGPGTNKESHTFNFGSITNALTGVGYNVQIVNGLGKIPTASLELKEEFSAMKTQTVMLIQQLTALSSNNQITTLGIVSNNDSNVFMSNGVLWVRGEKAVDLSFTNRYLKITDSIAWGKILGVPNFITAQDLSNNNYVTEMCISQYITSSNNAFSNAVLGIALNIDTNAVAVLNEIASTFGDFPITGTATSIGSLLLALAAAIAWLKKNKANTNDFALDASGNPNGTYVNTLMSDSNAKLKTMVDGRISAALGEVNAVLNDILGEE